MLKQYSNIKTAIIFGFAIIMICSCSKKDEMPKEIIPVEGMAMIFLDIYVAEAKINTLRIKTDSAKLLFRHYELQIFEEHGINDSIYQENFKYYLENPHYLEKAYDIVIDSLGVMDRVGIHKEIEKSAKEK